jgi:hypothetical protein
MACEKAAQHVGQIVVGKNPAASAVPSVKSEQFHFQK